MQGARPTGNLTVTERRGPRSSRHMDLGRDFIRAVAKEKTQPTLLTCRTEAGMCSDQGPPRGADVPGSDSDLQMRSFAGPRAQSPCAWKGSRDSLTHWGKGVSGPSWPEGLATAQWRSGLE